MGEKREKRPQQGDEQVLESTAADMQENLESSNEAGESADDGAQAENVAEAVGTETDASETDAPEVAGHNGDGSAVQDRESARMLDESVDESEIEKLREELRSVQAKADEYLDQLQRTAAEFQNSRKRQEKQLADAIERANGSLVARLLPVLDDFALAFENIANVNSTDAGQASDEQASQNGVNQAWLGGFRQISKKLKDILREQGLELIDATGEFDPVRHEAITSEPSDEVESGHIIAVLRAGYEYKGRVLRPALVRVAA